MNIVFLGSNHNLISIECLRGILTGGQYSVLVGIDNQTRDGFLSTFGTGVRRYGLLSFSLKVADHLAREVIGRVPGFRRSDGAASLKDLCQTYHADWMEVADVNGHETVRRVSAFRPDLTVVANFSQIIRKEFLSIPGKGCINYHPSLLPKYRGPVPLYWMRKNRERTGGGTVHFLEERLDSGDVILQREFSIKRGETEAVLLRRAAALGREMMVETLGLFRSGTVSRTPQDESKATYYSFPRMSRQEGAR